jgi:hypothetical protein
MQDENRKIFISYSSPDSVSAQEFIAFLESMAVEAIIDERAFDLGEDIKEEINNYISQCRILCILVSQNTKNSDWVRYEYFKGRELKIKTVLVRLEPCQTPDWLPEMGLTLSIDLSGSYRNVAIGLLKLLEFAGVATRINHYYYSRERGRRAVTLANQALFDEKSIPLSGSYWNCVGRCAHAAEASA